MINLIACVDKNWGIGNNGNLLFRIEQDKEFFKSMTVGKTVIMGRKTFDSLNIKPLSDRLNIVLTRNKNFEHEGVIICHSAEEALDFVKNRGEQVFVIGGEEIYRMFLPYCDKAYITKADDLKAADAHMVNLDNEKDWELVSETKDFLQGEFAYRFAVYEKIKQ